MNRLDKTIGDMAFILDSLILLRQIQSTGDCNVCKKNRECGYMPKAGQMVRYNCPFYKAESEIHCNCTDAEINNSFIEDVEAVKMRDQHNVPSTHTTQII